MTDSRQNEVDFGSLTDAQLVSLARQGDKDAFGQLVLRHRQKCIDIAGYFLRNRGDAEDEAQNAFVKAFRHLDQYQNEAELSTWLSRIVTNQCPLALRTRRRARYVYLDQAPTEFKVRPLELPSSGPDPEGALAAVHVKWYGHHRDLHM